MTREDRNIWIGTTYDDALAARAWLAALGFEEGLVVLADDGVTVQHSEMLWPEGGRVMVSTRRPDAHLGRSPGNVTCYVVTGEPDAVWARAQAAGAEVTRPMAETDYGSRGFSVRDPEGNAWSFGTYAGA